MSSQVGLDSISSMAGRERATKKRERQWFLYLLRCGDNTFYTGITTDLERRLTQHNDGSASRYTRSRKPVKIVYHETCDDYSAALKRECAVKKLTRDEKKRLVQGNSGCASAIRKKSRSKGLDSR